MSPRRPARLVALTGLVALLAGSTLACAGGARAAGPNMIVLGFDGLDYELTRELIDAGRMPNFKRLEESGMFVPLRSALSPQSPVAWSDFTTGLDSGGHGIFDFLHRDSNEPLPFGLPFQSTTITQPPGRTVQLGRWILPLSGGGFEQGRHGTPFWQVLEENGIETTILRMPANFPPTGAATRELSGMGTPDLRGTPGEFTFFSTDRRQFLKTDVNGGDIYPADVVDGVFEGAIYALDDNPLTEDADDPVSADLTVFLDPDRPVAKVELGDAEIVLQEGEWSDWISVDFEMIPYLSSMSGAVRLYLKSVRPEFELYVTPIQVDPAAPAFPISTPEDYAAELAEASGRFYTQEMPEDTQAVRFDVLEIDEFLSQAAITRQEMLEQYRHVLEGWAGGFLFYYMGSADQISHVLWGLTKDPEHPAYVPEMHDPYTDVIADVYEVLDGMVGTTLDRMPEDTTLVVMSDHGFTSWRRAFHLNTWLVQNGYMQMERDRSLPVDELFAGVDWRRTQAYSLGISGLYLNLRGRENQGIVAPGDRDELLARLEADLLAAVDPATGEPAVTRVFIRERDFHDRGNTEIGPDIVVGFAEGVRGSGINALGGMPEEFISDNVEEWSGDHIMDPAAVPGVLLSSRPLSRQPTALQNLAAALLAELGIDDFPDGSTPVTVNDDEE